MLSLIVAEYHFPVNLLHIPASSSFLTHAYSVRVAVSHSWDFFIRIKFCEAIESSSLLCAVGLYIKCLDPQCLTVLLKLVLLSFYCLSNLEFGSLIRLGNWFNCLLLLMHIRSKI